jgi:hypothetical protein
VRTAHQPSALEAALAKHNVPVPVADKRAAASQAMSAAVRKAPGYHPGLGAIYHPADTVAFLADQLEASGVGVVREAYGFRTMTAAEKADRAVGASVSAAQAKRVAA